MDNVMTIKGRGTVRADREHRERKSAAAGSICRGPGRTFAGRTGSMLRLDLRRMLTAPMFYVMLGLSLAMPVLILVMTTATAGAAIADPQTGVVTTMEGFTNAWQIIGSSDGGDMGQMDMTAMCNINLIFFLTGAFLCLFTGEDFRSGFAKHLFAVRARKGDYIASKTIIGVLAGAAFLIAFFLGTILGGRFAGLTFDLGDLHVVNLVMCMLAKIFLMSVFAAISVLMSVYAKSRTWLSILLTLFGGMMLFMMIPMMTPLNAGPMQVMMCLAGGAIFAAGIGVVSRILLNRVSLV